MNLHSGYGAAALSKTSTFSLGILSDDSIPGSKDAFPGNCSTNIDDAGILNTEFARRLGNLVFSGSPQFRISI